MLLFTNKFTWFSFYCRGKYCSLDHLGWGHFQIAHVYTIYTAIYYVLQTSIFSTHYKYTSRLLEHKDKSCILGVGLGIQFPNNE